MTHKITLKDIETLVAAQLGKRTATASQRFFADLGAESIDVVNVVAAVEETYDISLDNEASARIDTVDDLFKVVQRAAQPSAAGAQ